MLWHIWRIKNGLDDHQTQKQEYQQEMDSLRERESELSESAVSSKAALAKVSKKLAQFEKNIGHKEKTLNKVTPKKATGDN